MENLRCGCVILNYNDSDTVVQLLSEIKSYSAIEKTVIVDNHSTDRSAEVLREYTSSDVELISTDRNGGYGYGNNFGVKYLYEAYGLKYILIVNPDVHFTEEVLERCLLELSRRSDGAVISPVQLDRSGRVINLYAWRLQSPMRELMQNEFLFRHTLGKRKKQPLCADVCAVDCIPGSFLLIDAARFLEVGGYNEKMFLYYEENTLGIRLKKKGYSTYLVPDCQYVHEHSVSIDKSHPNTVAKRRIQYQSLLEYLKTDCGVGKGMLLFATVFLKICLFEEKIIKWCKR